MGRVGGTVPGPAKFFTYGFEPWDVSRLKECFRCVMKEGMGNCWLGTSSFCVSVELSSVVLIHIVYMNITPQAPRSRARHQSRYCEGDRTAGGQSFVVTFKTSTRFDIHGSTSVYCLILVSRLFR